MANGVVHRYSPRSTIPLRRRRLAVTDDLHAGYIRFFPLFSIPHGSGTCETLVSVFFLLPSLLLSFFVAVVIRLDAGFFWTRMTSTQDSEVYFLSLSLLLMPTQKNIRIQRREKNEGFTLGAARDAHTSTLVTIDHINDSL